VGRMAFDIDSIQNPKAFRRPSRGSTETLVCLLTSPLKVGRMTGETLSTYDWFRMQLLGRLPVAHGVTAWINRTRHDARDALVLLGVAFVAFAFSIFYDLPRKIFQFALDHEDWYVDDLVFIGFPFSLAWIVYGARRYQDSSREIKERRSAELEARNLARHDPLTGLPNRRFFAEKLNECLRSASDAQRVAVLMLDLDGFKLVNDLHGHGAGDKALIEFSERISAVLRADDVLARIGGDEFAVIMPKTESLDDPKNLAGRIVAEVAQPFLIDNAQMDLGVGVGIAMAPNDGINPEELVRRADRALYRAKGEGRSSTRFFEPEMDAHVERRNQIERELRSAITANLIIPHYQPLVSLKDNRIIGFEALARWESKNLGSIPPDVFIPLAEEIGLIGVLGDQLLRQACSDAKEWPTNFILAFNISAIQLCAPAFSLRILAILSQSGLSPRRLEIEITESALVDNIAVAQGVIDDLRQAGVRISLDDFGTGYATLTQLLSFHLDKIKIDRSFVSRLAKDKDSLVIVRAILGLARGFGLTATAEGVEDDEQLACLKENGCAEGQGYLFGKAVPTAEIPALLKLAPHATVTA
jgi:diguanylate cyclase (GGDEF)-like protein